MNPNTYLTYARPRFRVLVLYDRLHAFLFWAQITCGAHSRM